MTFVWPAPSFETVYQEYNTWILYSLIMFGQERTLQLLRIHNDAMRQLLAHYFLLTSELAHGAPVLTFDFEQAIQNEPCTQDLPEIAWVDLSDINSKDFSEYIKGFPTPDKTCKDLFDTSNKRKAYGCLFCDRTYASTDGARKHAKKHHENKLFGRGDVSAYCSELYI